MLVNHRSWPSGVPMALIFPSIPSTKALSISSNNPTPVILHFSLRDHFPNFSDQHYTYTIPVLYI
jgi:hypothetical protein